MEFMVDQSTDVIVLGYSRAAGRSISSVAEIPINAAAEEFNIFLPPPVAHPDLSRPRTGSANLASNQPILDFQSH
jgi:hypothetical protein